MESCGVCFSIGETDQGERLYVAPDLLPSFEIRRIPAWSETADTSTLRLEYRFFHPAIIRRLMSRIGRQAGDSAEYWKYGFWLEDSRRDTQLLVQFEDLDAAESPGSGALIVKAQGRDPLGVLRQIRKAIVQEQIGEEPEELLTLSAGTAVARRALGAAIGGLVLDVEKRPVPAAAYAAFFDDRESLASELPASGERAAIDIIAGPLVEGEKAREVFISYAWGDDTPDGKMRDHAVDSLQAALAADGFEPVRDRDHIHPGELISVFMRRLTRADRVVAIISGKYLQSPSCMYEIYKVWQRSQADAEDFLQHLVPVILPGVKLSNLEDRIPYIKYWSGREEALRVSVGELGARLSRESWEEFRLVVEFAHHVDGILVFLKDVLMPRNLEAQVADGFAAVRQVLRERMTPGLKR